VWSDDSHIITSFPQVGPKFESNSVQIE